MSIFLKGCNDALERRHIYINTTAKNWVSYGNSHWHASKYQVHNIHYWEVQRLWSLCTTGWIFAKFMYLVFTRMPCESNRRQLRSLLLCLCEVFRAPIDLLKLILHTRSGPCSVLDIYKQYYQIVSTNRTAVDVNRRSSEIQGTALGKCLQKWPVYTGPCLRV